MSTPLDKKPNTSERLAELEKSVAEVQKDAEQTSKTLEHAQVALKPEVIGAALVAALVSGGISAISSGWTLVKADLPTLKDFTPRIDAYLDRKFGFTSEPLRTERKLERRLTGIDLSIDVHDTKISRIGERADAAFQLAARADSRARAVGEHVSRTRSAVRELGSQPSPNGAGSRSASQASTAVQRLESQVNRLISALS
ncbi:hypothetical protein [Streptomyces spectabilis]|uniref:Uncharacterized protein n=1 Tax=Streptomyces spectabilis TaxID=68270 RepID=A0A5P2X8Z7_STRST|nr:hypothetical protein [Streptomyces spectabilis]MBB5108128.1 hypothetical protein [Streptomyces spectabilis]MCI3904351.1 hypothetical protein [Streptomyces spectabilis]QEV61457.1 hypothetical protein CP982_24405 [Streptomyces spectabilis]GGV26691.1 hypothetical protein GCM10010245_43830 [Streptomyces spectabilis]